MELEGVVHNGVIVPDDTTVLAEGTRVRISPALEQKPKPFGQRFAQFKGAVPRLPADLAHQHDHYRLGTPQAMTVFADTFALIAWLNPRDEAHSVGAAYLDGFTGRLLSFRAVFK